MYTEFHFNAELKADVPQNVLDILRFMLKKTDICPELPPHPLFETERWKRMLMSDSYCFSADTHSTLRFDNITNSYYLCVRCNLKNYDNEIGKFTDWIMPYLGEPDGNFLGFSRYEENEQPNLIFYKATKKD